MDRAADIRSRLDSVGSKWPWRVRPEHTDHHTHVFGPDEHRWPVASCASGRDAEFIANAPEDVWWLLEEVDRLRARVRMYEVIKS